MPESEIEFTEPAKIRRPQVTPDQIADKIEHLINEADPSIKTKRGAGSLIEVRLGRAKWSVVVFKPRRKAAV